MPSDVNSFPNVPVESGRAKEQPWATREPAGVNPGTSGSAHRGDVEMGRRVLRPPQELIECTGRERP